MSNVTFAPGQRVGSYDLLLELAAGGTATVGIAVYRGAAGFERLVVVKRLHRHLTKEREFTAMLLDEARLASSIRHPNVVPVIDVVRTDEEVTLVMDYIESVSLAQLVRAAIDAGGRLPAPVVSRVVVDALVGLHEAHEAKDIRGQPLGIVHRDVSPQNIVVGVDGVSRVIDFGIAKARSRLAHTRAGVIKGKCAYMAPEQVDGQPVDRRCDVFSAGILLWEALTATRLFRGEDEFEEMRRVMRAPIHPPSSLVPELAGDVDGVLAQALARPLAERFQTALAFARALEHAIPPASAQVVAACVASTCAAELEHRHGRLQAILGEELDKLSPRSPGHASASKVAPPARFSLEPTMRLEPEPPRAPSGATLRSAEGPPSSAEPTVDPTAPREAARVPKRSLMPVLVGVTLVSLVAGAGVATAVIGTRPAAEKATAAPSSSTASTTPSASQPPQSAPEAPSVALPAAPVAAAPATGTASVPADSAASPPSPPPSARPTRTRPAPSPASAPRPSTKTDLKSNPYEH